jgi:hypothetical protein
MQTRSSSSNSTTKSSVPLPVYPALTLPSSGLLWRLTPTAELEQEEYQREKIDWSFVEFRDNQVLSVRLNKMHTIRQYFFPLPSDKIIC